MKSKVISFGWKIKLIDYSVSKMTTKISWSNILWFYCFFHFLISDSLLNENQSEKIVLSVGKYDK